MAGCVSVVLHHLFVALDWVLSVFGRAPIGPFLFFDFLFLFFDILFFDVDWAMGLGAVLKLL